MDLARLQAFVTVVHRGSFTAAAEALGTDKARVSRAVSALERELGLKLLERTTRALALTDAGRSVAERARAILGASDDLVQFARSLHDEPQGLLRLSCSADFALIAANRWILGYRARFPKVAVEVDVSPRVVDLVHEGFDLALRVGRLEDSRMAARLLGRIRYGLFASPGYLARAGVPATPAELSRHALLMFVTGRGRRGWTLLPAAGKGAAVTVDGASPVTSGALPLLRDACLAGLGIARLPLALAAGTPPGALVPVLTAWTPQPVPVHAVFPSNRLMAPKVRAFVDHAVAAFEADLAPDAPWPSGPAPG